MNIAYKDYPSIIGGGTPTPTPEPTPEQITTSYIVKSGDTLWGISERYLGNGVWYPEIKSLNELTTDTIYPGQTLKISTSGANSSKTYTVQKGDTLWGIAEKFLGNGSRYSEIKNLNSLTSDTIYPGQVLNIPN